MMTTVSGASTLSAAVEIGIRNSVQTAHRRESIQRLGARDGKNAVIATAG
jgi:hypothetical protein